MTERSYLIKSGDTVPLSARDLRGLPLRLLLAAPASTSPRLTLCNHLKINAQLEFRQCKAKKI